ncbi:MAG: hypothetical protein GC150_17650 [Rhizobiales bacterium]|nr:hypothetical protein [Hyphomicrobiales bacterium]
MVMIPLRFWAFALCLWAAVSVPGARAAGVGTGLIVDVDPGLQLSCVDTITFSPSAQELTQLVTGIASPSGEVTRPSSGGSVSVSASPGGWSVTIGGMDTSILSTTYADEALDMCLVQAIGFRFGSYVVSAQLTGNTLLTGPGGSSVSVTSVGVRPGHTTGAYSNQFSVNWFTLFFFLGGQFTVDFRVVFDLANAARTGLHSSTTPGVIRVTASAP